MRKPRRLGNWRNKLVASRRFQKWVAGMPFLRGIARKEGEALFDLISGFVYSQVLMAVVELDILADLHKAPQTARALGHKHGISTERMTVLLKAAVGVKLLTIRRDGRFDLTQRGAAMLGVPGLQAMVKHHGAFYRDLSDPVAFLREETQTELADFWPYVFGADGGMPADQARVYSDLMADSQSLVAEDTLRSVSFKGISTLMDVGGGSGAFLSAVGAAYPKLQMQLFDLPDVAPQAKARFNTAGQGGRVDLVAGSFRDQALPTGADAISLIRVLYDHSDATIADLLAKVYAALPQGGRLIISEPMSGGAKPSGPGDAYFAFYTMAMRTGRARSAQEITDFCSGVGFVQIETPKAHRPFVTSVVTAVKP
jgi:demethylspheroidene O-methyltransferase